MNIFLTNESNTKFYHATFSFLAYYSIFYAGTGFKSPDSISFSNSLSFDKAAMNLWNTNQMNKAEKVNIKFLSAI